MKRALLAVDVQNDFCDDGALPVNGGYAVARTISKMLGNYDFLAATRDWHIDPGAHFEDWPVHCKAGTPGAELAAPLTVQDFDIVVNKGQREAAYSAFDVQNLETVFKSRGIANLDVVGLATDYCVKASVLDAIKHGFSVSVLLYACAGVDKITSEAAVHEMAAAGAEIIHGP